MTDAAERKNLAARAKAGDARAGEQLLRRVRHDVRAAEELLQFLQRERVTPQDALDPETPLATLTDAALEIPGGTLARILRLASETARARRQRTPRVLRDLASFKEEDFRVRKGGGRATAAAVAALLARAGLKLET